MGGITINERLFALLREQNRKQHELARAIGIPERSVSAWKERGTDPPAKLIIPIARFFGVTVEWFLSGTGERSPKAAEAASEGEAELLRIYGLLNARARHKFLGLAYEFEDEYNGGKL